MAKENLTLGRDDKASIEGFRSNPIFGRVKLFDTSICVESDLIDGDTRYVYVMFDQGDMGMPEFRIDLIDSEEEINCPSRLCSYIPFVFPHEAARLYQHVMKEVETSSFEDYRWSPEYKKAGITIDQRLEALMHQYVEDYEQYIESMIKEYGMTPEMELLRSFMKPAKSVHTL